MAAETGGAVSGAPCEGAGLVGWLVGVRVFYAGWDWLGLTGTSWDTNNVDVVG